MINIDWWKVPFLPIIALLMFFIEPIVIPATVPMIIREALTALGLFVLYKAGRYIALKYEVDELLSESLDFKTFGRLFVYNRKFFFLHFPFFIFCRTFAREKKPLQNPPQKGKT